MEAGDILEPVRNISEAFTNLSRIAYYRRKIISESNIISKIAHHHADDFIKDLTIFQEAHPDFIQRICLIKKVVITVQSKWMKAQLKELTRESSKNNLGILSDTTYKFFHQGFLLTSSIYSPVLSRWIPIVFSYIRKEDEEHMKEHFRFLMDCLQDEMTSAEFEEALNHVVDFSSAEHNAFIQAYVDLGMSPHLALDPKMSEPMKAAHEYELSSKAEGHLKGCEQHYRYDIFYY